MKFTVTKTIHDKITANILKCEKLIAFSLRSGVRKFLPSSFLFKIVLGVLARVIRKKEKKRSKRHPS
jgi:hypothetical protein